MSHEWTPTRLMSAHGTLFGRTRNRRYRSALVVVGTRRRSLSRWLKEGWQVSWPSKSGTIAHVRHQRGMNLDPGDWAALYEYATITNDEALAEKAMQGALGKLS